ncbi:MAG TPA: glycosyltransferase [Candidatus Limiplasma sp.]|nr:glycosyltransferase [Candidatus Limiplasma sp.]
MNVLFLSLLYHPETVKEVTALSRVGLQNQANSFQWAMIEGLKNNLRAGETIEIVNSLPVGIYPRQYRRLRLRRKAFGKQFTEIGSLNLPYCKQNQRERTARWMLQRWVEQSSQNRMIVVYSLYLPYLRAVAAVKQRYPEVKTCIIVTDLPGRLGLASGRKGLPQKMEYRMGNESMRLAAQMDGFILLTEQMTEPLSALHKKYCIIEGMTSDQGIAPQQITMPKDSRPAVAYTGTLNRELGIAELLEAFQQMNNVQLWLCGRGDMDAAIADAQSKFDNIHSFGFVPQAQAIYLQSNAELLINPRTNQGAYTRYSFPSKTMEYMHAGKPVLCCKLEGIPAEYDEYLTYIQPQNAEGIRSAVQGMLHKTQQERDDIGRRAKEFVLSKKNNIMQGKKAVDLLRTL